MPVAKQCVVMPSNSRVQKSKNAWMVKPALIAMLRAELILTQRKGAVDILANRFAINVLTQGFMEDVKNLAGEACSADTSTSLHQCQND